MNNRLYVMVYREMPGIWANVSSSRILKTIDKGLASVFQNTTVDVWVFDNLS